MSEESKVPTIGGAVLVSFYGELQKLSTIVAHVLAITGSGAGLDTADGIPAITVAYPDPTADPSILSSANWQKAYVRRTGVVHYTHQSAVDGKESIVWGYPVRLSDFPSLIKQDAPTINPVFDRPVDAEVPEIPLGLHGAVTLRSESEPATVTTTAPATEPIVETKEYSDGTTATGVAPLPELSSAQQDAGATATTDPAVKATEATETGAEPTS
jgi:hypothetical protein